MIFKTNKCRTNHRLPTTDPRPAPELAPIPCNLGCAELPRVFGVCRAVPIPNHQAPTPWFVYILECQDGSFYTGVTNDLDRRMKIHAEGKGSKYVRNKKFKKLLRTKQCESKSDAQKAECHIKTLYKWDKLNWFNSKAKL
ncbi:GIY-YIG nuclease family protein [Candidatus Pacearchaeota archaeon]|nr:GIY-YIG nuclease family protein [Candidatus Pacearchaeota archaeon]